MHLRLAWAAARVFLVLLLGAGLTLLPSCRTTPFPDPTTEFRQELKEEIGPLEPQLGRWTEIIDPEYLGSAAREYHRHFRVTRALSGDPETYQQEPFAYRMGMVPWRDGELGVQVFAPPQPWRGTVFFTHGYLAHMGVFIDMARYITEAGYVVVAFDLPGHGFSTGERANIESFDQYGFTVADMVQWAQDLPSLELPAVSPWVHRRRGTFSGGDELVNPLPFPEPWFALGHSTGATAFVIHGEHLRREGAESPFAHRILISPLVRNVYWGPAITYARLTWRLRRHYRPLIGSGQLVGSHNFPITWALALGDWNREVRREYQPQAGGVSILQGEQDDVVAIDYNLRTLQELLPESTVLLYPEMNHVMHRKKPENVALWQDVVDILNGVYESLPERP